MNAIVRAWSPGKLRCLTSEGEIHVIEYDGPAIAVGVLVELAGHPPVFVGKRALRSWQRGEAAE